MRMKYLFSSMLFALCLVTAPLCAANRYVSVNGTGDGSSWATAMGSIQAAIDASVTGDTVRVADGLYREVISIRDGVSVLGGYDAQTGERNVEAYATIIDGTGLQSAVVIKYDAACEHPTLIEGLRLQNAEHTSDGGGAYIRGNVILSKCYIYNCKGAAGAGVYNDGGIIRDCIVELCSGTSAAGGAYNKEGGIIENTIFRGNGGKYGTVCNYTNGVVRNCIFHNNTATVVGWPDCGGIYNPEGTVAHCIFASNYGMQYSGIHSEGKVVNSITWNNQAPDDFTDVTAYMASNAGSVKNASDNGNSIARSAMKLDADNNAEKGPRFKNPTRFAGIPTTEAQIEAMRAADWRFNSNSPCIDKGKSDDELVPATDIIGTTRPLGTAVDLGAYEHDPSAPIVHVESMKILPDTLKIIIGNTDWLSVAFTPENATSKTPQWYSSNSKVATVENGLVTAVGVGEAKITARIMYGNILAHSTVIVLEEPEVIVHPDVIAADALVYTDYSIPSYIKMLVAKEAARADSSAVNIAALREAVAALQPKETPHSIVATINGDPATRMGFAWFTTIGVNEGKLQIIAKADAVAEDFAAATEIEATHTEAKRLNYAVGTSGIPKLTGTKATTKYDYMSHKALATGLTPNTTYSYRVGSEGHWSDIMTFTTSAGTKEPFSFLYMSDSHIMDSVYIREANWAATTAVKNAPDAKFLLFTGDFVETGTRVNSEWEWEQWFNTSMRPLIDNVPLVPTDGNHDDSDNLNYTHHFNTDNYFNQIAKSKPQFEGITYSFVYGDALFLIYSHQDYWRNSNYLKSDVANWFREQVAAHPNTKWRIAAVHKNVFTGSGHQEDDDALIFREVMAPLFDELKIDFLIQGHDHVYEVIGPVDNATFTVVPGSVSDVKKTDKNSNTNMKGQEGGTFDVTKGTLYYVGATCGHKRYYPNSKAVMENTYEQHKVENYWDLFTGKFGQPGAPAYSHITVSTDSIVVSCYTGDSTQTATLFDSYKIVKTQPTVLEDVEISAGTAPIKVLEDGVLYIVRNEEVYNTLGMRVK